MVIYLLLPQDQWGEGKGHSETAPKDREFCEMGILQWIHSIHLFLMS